ncbi:MAG: ABC transporter ATP-binding protein [Oscillospiraceae bacterium]|nr:ABC transporter ATP-binding protein [Candidatus Limimonas coprohippi]MCQ2487922.1 ABC transporter ATP-binding protein [Clostridia bacterium]
MSEPIVEFKNVSKRYKLYSGNRQKLMAIFSKRVKVKTKDAIKGISFKVEPGESVALLGKNGAGKSTILKMITEVCFPTEGEIIVNGRVSALLELTAGFDPELTGRENIYLRGTTMGLKKEEIKALEPEIIEFADIGEYVDQPVRSYSSGMKSRLGFAINANVRPEILIVDEALSVGDATFRQKCLDKVNKLIADENVTLLLVTHSTNMARQFCKRGMVLDGGKIAFDGTVDEAIEKYDSIMKKAAEKKKKEAVLK